MSEIQAVQEAYHQLAAAGAEGQERRYYLLLRPPSIGTHPAGEIAGRREVWMPAQRIPDTAGDWRALGWVEYPRGLQFMDIWKYDLLPADRRERFFYRLWREGGNTLAGDVWETLAGYLEEGREFCEKWADDNSWAALAFEWFTIRAQG